MIALVSLLFFAATYFLASVLAIYVDHRADRRMQNSDLQPLPRLLIPFVWVIDPIYLYSPLFSRAQDRSTRWLVLPLRLCVAAAAFSLGVFVLLLIG